MENPIVTNKKNKRASMFLVIVMVSVVSTYLLIVGGALVSFHA